MSTPMASSPLPSVTPQAPGAARPWQFDRKYLPLAVTISLFVAMMTMGSVSYTGFFSLQGKQLCGSIEELAPDRCETVRY